ncbi:hypothetical protein AYJ54_00655 [Bradyrhizobium centrolobii]|uniref:Uncharacterized protein n=1 Tax=Bradyrhizobium centrolobii TaxID=1505087 RepID=A0A176YHZ0_9BRAD|nr:hypothetical protein [Bradyrhizobium centrolobii]OAF05449.1 hypothetical protein AYJ54_00655 [Bradyrhizobium centrolobii]
MSVSELRQAFKDLPGSENLIVSYADNGNQIIQIGDKSVEVGPMASNDEIRLALQNPFIRTENTKVSVTGAKFLAEQIRTQLAAAKAELATAGTDMAAAMTELQDTVVEAKNQVKAVKDETADLKAALGLNSNGGPA